MSHGGFAGCSPRSSSVSEEFILHPLGVVFDPWTLGENVSTDIEDTVAERRRGQRKGETRLTALASDMPSVAA
eukprot:5930108-Amphidinium_carterae.2